MATADIRSEETFADIARWLHDAPTVDQTLDRIVAAAVATVHCDSAGVFLRTSGRIESAAVTDPVVDKADQLQLTLGEGPCLEAAADRETLVIRDTATERRWSSWCRQVADLGLRSVLSLELSATGSGTTSGALNLYSVQIEAFDIDDAAIGRIFAGHAAIALDNARNELSLRRAVDARHVIGQAQGILMERFDLSADQAFAVLLRYSQDKNIKLREVAETVVSSRSLPS